MKSGRYCDSCTACCTALGVPELSKPPGARCEKLAEALVQVSGVAGVYEHGSRWGCGVYATRPASCRQFDCLWLQGDFAVDERPNVVGVVMSLTMPVSTKPYHKQRLIAYESFPGAFDSAPARAFLRRYSANKIIFLVRGAERFVIGPADERAFMERYLGRPIPTFELGEEEKDGGV